MPRCATHHHPVPSCPRRRRQIDHFDRDPSPICKVRKVRGSYSQDLALQLPSSLAPPSVLCRGPGVHTTVLGRRCQPSEVSDPQSNLSPSAQPGTPLFQAGKVAKVHPFRQHAPLCAHPPQGIQAQTQHLICGSLSSPGSRSETESKEKAGSGSVHTRGRRVCPITAPSPAPPRSALPARRRHLSPRRKGLSAGIAGTYRCGTPD